MTDKRNNKNGRGGGRQVLLTGFPTFSARHLFDRILEREPDTRLVCVVHDKHIDQARELVQDLDKSLQERVEVMQGDVCALDLGLSGREYLDLVENVTDVYHMAAVWHMGADKRRMKAVNVDGTNNIVQLVRDLKQLERFNHFSTAFVCGNRRGVIMEEEFDEGQSFRNPYEETQFEAERRVRQLRREYPITIFRPSLIVGHSETGEIDRMTGPYYLIQFLVNLPVDVPLPMLGTGDKPLNLVPVDYVVDALYTISRDDRAIGRTFHLVDQNPLAARRVMELVALAAGKPLPKGRLPLSLARVAAKLPLLEQTLRPGRNVLDDMSRWTIFNAMNTAELTAKGPRCPSFPDYVEPIVARIKRN